MPNEPMDGGLRELARRLRLERLEDLATDVHRLILEAMPDYTQRGSLSSTELHEACVQNVDRMLAELVDERGEEEALGVDSLGATGRRRAHQGVPLEALLYSFRLGGRVIWEGLIQQARRTQGGSELQNLASEAVAVWDVLDRVSNVVAGAYRDEQALLRLRTQRHQGAVLSALFEGSVAAGIATEDAADILGISSRTSCLVVVAVADPSVHDRVWTTRSALSDVGVTSVWTVTGARESGLVALPEGLDVDDVVRLLATHATGAVVISPLLDGYHEVPSAYHLAQLAVRSVPADFRGVLHALDRVPHALLASHDDIGRLIARHTLRGLLELPDADRRAYLDTIEAVVDAGGSYAMAAHRLYCHRNTVVKRANRIKAMTGLSLTHFGDLLELHLAVLAIRLDFPVVANP